MYIIIKIIIIKWPLTLCVKTCFLFILEELGTEHHFREMSPLVCKLTWSQQLRMDPVVKSPVNVTENLCVTLPVLIICFLHSHC